MKFISDVTFPSWPSQLVDPNFPKYQSDRKCNDTLKIQVQAAA